MMKRAIRAGMQGVLGTLAFFARRPSLTSVSNFLTRGLARLTVRAKGIGPADSLEALGDRWQRAFPAKKQVPIEKIEGNTVYARIHTPCPLRGTGDVEACYRMMEFDREVLRRAGGQFVVLDSQSEPGRTHCRVAMRMAGERIDDLVPAHRKGRGGGRG